MSPRETRRQQHGAIRILMVSPSFVRSTTDARIPRRAIFVSGVSGPHVLPHPRRHERETTMYDMYPDWGPASHHPDNPRSHENVSAALQASLDLRDNGGQRPDDN
jgi:hypothetical protein